MELGSLAVSGSLKVGLHISTNYKRPVLEIYHYVKNQIGPESEFNVPKGSSGVERETIKHRFQNISICFVLTNIGGVRAEDVELKISGELKRDKPRENFGEIFNCIISQIAPSQVLFLFSFDQHDLYEYPEGGGQPVGNKDKTFTITMAYNAPKGFINNMLSFFKKIRGKKQFFSTYTFSPKIVIGDLPPPEYL